MEILLPTILFTAVTWGIVSAAILRQERRERQAPLIGVVNPSATPPAQIKAA
jgi:hypothetical protein